jgi:hypothetical protein
MNKSIAILASLVVIGSAASSMAAVVGVVNLSSYDSGYAIVGVGGTAVDAANTYVSLQYQVGGGAWETVSVSATGATQWSPDDSSGYFDQSTGVLGTDAASTTVNFKLTAWTGSSSSPTASATATWSQTTGSWDNAANPPATPDSVVLQIPGTIQLVATPEPSTIALGLLGAGALLIRRRK